MRWYVCARRGGRRKMANQTVSVGINIETKGGRDEDMGGFGGGYEEWRGRR